MKDLNEVVQKVKGVEDNVTSLVIPILKDTIADGNRHNRNLFIISVILSVIVLIVSLFSQVLIMLQNKRYEEFLSQFEFESETTLIQNTDDNSAINSGINFNN